MTTPPAVAKHFERIARGRPTVQEDVVARTLRESYGVTDATWRALPGETERNFHVVAGGTTASSASRPLSASLRFAPEDELDTVRRQHRILEAFDPAPGAVATPRVVPTVAGADLVHLDGDEPMIARMLTWVPGEPLAAVELLSRELLEDVGRASGAVAARLSTIDEPTEDHYWDLRWASSVIGMGIDWIDDDELAQECRRVADVGERLLTGMDALPQALIHHDLNGLNILVEEQLGARRVSGIIDFGDAIVAPRIADLAVLIAAVSRGRRDPLGIATALTRGYCAEVALTADEVAALFPLVRVRAASVAATIARLAGDDLPGDPRHRRLPALTAQLRQLAAIGDDLAEAALRDAAGLDARESERVARAWLDREDSRGALVLSEPIVAVDLTPASPVFDTVDITDPAQLADAATAAMRSVVGAVAIGRHAEPVFTEQGLRATGEDSPATRSLGVRIAGTNGLLLHAPWAGRVDAAVDGEAVLRHQPAPGVDMWTRLVGAAASLPVGSDVSQGSPWAVVTSTDEPVVLQVLLVDPTKTSIPLAVPSDRLDLWEHLVVDPSSLVGTERWLPRLPEALVERSEHLPWTHPTYFESPINMVRARDCWFVDEEARRYLDALNNVTLVGHCHPRLIEAATKQMRRLNTNSRFVYDVLSEYLDRLSATLPDGLDVVYMLNSGSEANDLALRMARHATGRRDIVIIEDAYHGYTDLVSDVSPARFKHYGKPDFTHVTVNPDRYRGPFGYDDPDAGAHYAQLTIDVFDRLIDEGRPPAAYIYEPLLAGGGQVVLPPGFLAPIHEAARERGILTISDEVQVGFGRLGEGFWGFQTQGPDVVPDFVSMGKAMGNGFPMSALVTTREHSQAFDELGRFFATYGGNPVAAAVGLELLDVMRDEGLQQNALEVGAYFREELWNLAEKHELIGDVRGQGFYSGVEFVLDRETREPAGAETLKVCDRLKDEGVLVYPTGPNWNVLKLKPPLTFTRREVDLFVETLDRVLLRGW